MLPCGSLFPHCQEGDVNESKVQGQWKQLAG
jgi:hypothetical protein